MLEMMYPRRSFGQSDYSKTLKELDLLPRSSMRLNPIQGRQVSNLTAAADSEGAGLIAGVYNTLTSALGYFNPFAYLPSFTPTTRAEAEEGPERDPRADPIPQQPQQPVSTTSKSPELFIIKCKIPSSKTEQLGWKCAWSLHPRWRRFQ